MKARRFIDRLADGASPNFWAALGLTAAFAILVVATGAL